MTDAVWSFFGWKKRLLPDPPSVTITGVRIPADGTSAHLAPLTTISTASASGGTDAFLFHIPDLRQFWDTEDGWECRDVYRLKVDLWQQQHLPEKQGVQKEHHLQQWDYLIEHAQDRLAYPYRLLQRQRQKIPHLRLFAQEHHSSCIGLYYIFYSFNCDNLPRNPSIPTWMTELKPYWYGDVFLVKVAPYEYGGYGWALYEDIAPEFLELLAYKRGFFDISQCDAARAIPFGI